MNRQKIILILVGLIVLWAAWASLRAMSGKCSSEGFTDGSATQTPGGMYQSNDASVGAQKSDGPYTDLSGSLVSVRDETQFSNTSIERPYATTDDYEYNAVFRNEGSRELSDNVKNALTSQYPISWENLPPSSAQFQQGQADLYNTPTPTPPAPSQTPYSQIDGSSLTPPDLDAVEEEEKKILATYAPKHTADMAGGSYNLEDTNDLINKIYAAKGLEAEVQQDSINPNIYQIVSTSQLKNSGQNSYAQQETLPIQTSPQAALDMSANLDPFYEPRTGTRNNRNDYSSWSPELNRMFPPSYKTG